MAKVTGEGTIVQLEKDKPKSKCRKWQLRVSTGLDPRTGKYKIRTRRIKGIYTEMAKALRTFIVELEHDAVQGRSKYTFEEYTERYLEQRRAKKEIADTTLARQRCQLKVICRHIGKANLSAVTTVMLNDMYIAMLNGDTSSGVPSGGSYVNQIHNNVKLVFDRAVEEGILTVNPALKATPPKMDTAEKRALTQAKADELLFDLDPTSDRDCAYLIALTLGLRRGEVCGLSWGDIDFDERLVYINHCLTCWATSRQPRRKLERGPCRCPMLPTWRSASISRRRPSATRGQTNTAIRGTATSGRARRPPSYPGRAASASSRRA